MAGPPPLPTKGRTVMGGRYRLLAHVGTGSVGEVFHAELVSSGQPVAVKILKDDLRGDAEAMARFRRGAELLATVDHPAIVKVLDHGADADGTMVVMERVEGEPFDHLLREGPMHPRRAVHLFSQVAHGLAALHAKGIVHRDLKPENVVITGGLLGEQAKLLDFGLARLADPEQAATPAQAWVSGVQKAGRTVGTPAYAAPEQVRGEPGDARSDVYSFGVLAYLMLTGRLPFTGDADQLLQHHLSSQPAPMTSVLPGLARHAALCAVVMKCLEKNPLDRFQDGAALAAAIDLIDSGGLEERPVMVLERPSSGWGGRLMLLVLSLLLALAPRLALERPLEHATWARWLLRAGRPGLALEVLGGAPSATEPRWIAAKAVALHQQGHDEQVRALMAGACRQILSYAPELRAVEDCSR